MLVLTIPNRLPTLTCEIRTGRAVIWLHRLRSCRFGNRVLINFFWCYITRPCILPGSHANFVNLVPTVKLRISGVVVPSPTVLQGIRFDLAGRIGVALAISSAQLALGTVVVAVAVALLAFGRDFSRLPRVDKKAGSIVELGYAIDFTDQALWTAVWHQVHWIVAIVLAVIRLPRNTTSVRASRLTWIVLTVILALLEKPLS